jgi:hypothetical protein
MSMESHGGMMLTAENERTCRETCPSATLSITNPTWTDPGAKPGLRGEILMTNRLSYGTAFTLSKFNRSVIIINTGSLGNLYPLLFYVCIFVGNI